VATHWHAFLKPELHGLLTPRTDFLNSWQTNNTCLTSAPTFGPTYRTRAFAQIKTKRNARVFFFDPSFIQPRSFLKAKILRHVVGRDGHHLTLALKDSDVGANHKISRQCVNTPTSMALINSVLLGIWPSSLKRGLMLCRDRTRTSYIQNAVSTNLASAVHIPA
jgi:hypothetical protein